MLERLAPYIWERPHMWNICEWIVRKFMEEFWTQHFRMTCSAFDKLCDAVGHYVAPAAVRRELVPTEKCVT